MRSQMLLWHTVTEPFIVPALYEKYATVGGFTVIDEWMLCVAMGKNVAKELENHYATFIVGSTRLLWFRTNLPSD